ncbi:MAG: DUF2975 domain-containing protein [Flavobacteriaceae bacterium]|nr:DUF2975 domain-containing protein [Flavobacteriaceae bacterium]
MKTVLDLFWFFTLISIAGMLIFIPFYLFSSDIDIPIKIKGQEILAVTILAKIVVFVNIISGLLFFYSIYLLRKLVGLFQKREIFNDEVVRLFNLIGKLVIASSVISTISLFVYNAVERNHLGLTLDFGGYDSFLISVSLGLFFMVISEIFKIAKNMKEESDLMI